MARRGRVTVEIELTGEERRTLQRWARRHSSSQALAFRCRIVLACADKDRTNDQIAEEFGCNPATVSKWRRRFAVERLDGLMDAPRPGAKRTIGDDVVEAVVIDTLVGTARVGGRPPKPTAESIDRNVMAAAREFLDEIAPTRRAATAAPLGRLRRALLAARLADAFEVLATEAVDEARHADGGPTWMDVGEAFGIRAQSAQTRFRVERSETDA